MASEAASSVLGELIDSVIDSYELVILLRVKNRPPPALTLTQAIAAQGLEVLDSTPYPSSTGPVSLTHLKVIKQHVPNLCGYHSLYNVLESVRYLKLKNGGRRWKVADMSSFWKFHFRTTKFIAEECVRRGDDHYWKVRNARHGDLERCFLKYLLQGNDHLIENFESTREFFSQLHVIGFQFGSLQMERGDVMKVQRAIDDFLVAKGEGVLGFMMGVTNHWVSLVAHCVGGFREFVFLDSRNRNYLKFDEAAIVSLYETVQRERIETGRKPLNNWELTVAHQGVKDIQSAVHILMECLTGRTTLPQVVVTHKVQHLLQNFEETPGDSFIEKLETFFRAGFPAKFIYDDYVAHLLSYPQSALSPPCKQRLSQWTHNCDEAIRKGYSRASWEAKYFHQLVVGKLRAYLAPMQR